MKTKGLNFSTPSKMVREKMIEHKRRREDLEAILVNIRYLSMIQPSEKLNALRESFEVLESFRTKGKHLPKECYEIRVPLLELLHQFNIDILGENIASNIKNVVI